MTYSAQAARIVGPAGGLAFPAEEAFDTLSGTTGEDSTAAMPLGAVCTIVVGNAAVRFNLRATAAQADQVATTDPVLAANARHDFTVTDASRCVYVESADAATPYEVWVWVSG